MASFHRDHVSDLRGASRMVIDALAGTGVVVEQMHTTIARHALPLGRSAVRPASGLTGLVYRTLQGSFRLAGAGVDAVLAPLEQWAPQGMRAPAHEALVAAVNGVYGDYLERTHNPLALRMALRRRGIEVDPLHPALGLQAAGDAAPSSRLLVLVHGLCMNDRQWCREGHDHGEALAQALGCSVLYLRYNSGRPIHDNGRQFAELLEPLVAHWPVLLDELVLIGHSMGGLVARSACAQAGPLGHAWLGRLRQLVFLGTPHFGAPLERGGRAIDLLLGLSPYSVPFNRVGGMRSAGIKDLRHGSVLAAPQPAPALPAGVACFAAAGTLAAQHGLLADKLVGDGLVPLDSALGRHRDPARALHIPKAQQWVGHETGHLQLLSRPEVYAQLLAWLGGPVPPAARARPRRLKAAAAAAASR